MATTKTRIAVTLDEDQERALYDLRKTDEFCKCSMSEIIRRLLDRELSEMEQDRNQTA